MSSKKTAETRTKPVQSNLDSRYGKIGIAALAAALRYSSETKSTADAPASPRDAKWDKDMAA